MTESAEAAAGGRSSTTDRSSSLLRAEAQSQAGGTGEPQYADATLPGVGRPRLALGRGLRAGGYGTLATLVALNLLDELEFAALVVLGPDIGNTLDLSDGTVTFVMAAGLLFAALGAAALGRLADRCRRGPTIGAAASAAAVFTAATGLATSAFTLFAARASAGLAKAGAATAQPSLLADAYPLGTRGRLFAAHQGAARLVGLSAGPVVVGAVAVGLGPDNWRWVFAMAAVPALLLGFSALRLPEPPRGQWERRSVLGDPEAALGDRDADRGDRGADGADPGAAISPEAALAGVWGMRTVRHMAAGLVAMGIVMFPARSVETFFLYEEHNLNAFGRGLAVAPAGLGLLVALPLVGRRFDDAYRADPAGAVRLVGMLLLPVAVLVPLQYLAGSLPLFVVFGAAAATFLGAAFSMVQPVLQAVFPHRLRGAGAAVAAFFLVAVGGVGGSLVVGFLQDEFGERPAVVGITLAAVPLGSWLIIRGARHMRRDLSLIVSQIREEQSERDLRLSGSPGDVAVLHVSDIDFSYGHVQVLFGFGLEVMRGETVAVLGANGAGKSTAVGVIAGLRSPSRGVIRLNGRNITLASPEQRAAMGIQMLPGGQGVWPQLSVEDNLMLGADAYRSDRADQARRIEAALGHFPAIADRRRSKARELSGGMQQQLALARVMLHEPEILIIDELSLGLAPIVVESLCEVVDGLKAGGQTMVIIEQSVSTALSLADRAVFMEKGRVHFEGTSAELRDNPRLAQTVFFREGTP